MSSENYEENAYTHDLDLLIILNQLCVLILQEVDTKIKTPILMSAYIVQTL